MDKLRDVREAEAAFLAHARTKLEVTQRTCGKGKFSWRGRWKTFNQEQFKDKWPSFSVLEKTKAVANTLTDTKTMDAASAKSKATAYYGHSKFDTDACIGKVHSILTQLNKYKEGHKQCDDQFFEAIVLEALHHCATGRAN